MYHNSGRFDVSLPDFLPEQIMAQQPSTQDPSTKKPLQRVWALTQAIWRRVENIVFGVVLFFLILYLVLQMPVVQNWLIGKITAYLSDELHTTVEVRNVNISFFDNLVLEGFYVQDLKGDTLLYAGELTAGLNSNIFTLMNNKLEFNEISLSKARFNIRRKEGDYDNNLQFILDYFATEPKRPPKKPVPFRIRIQNLRLNDVEFLQDDEVRGQRMHYYLPSAAIRVNNLDIPSKIVDIRSADIHGFSLAIEERPSRPLPERAVPVAQAISSSVDSINAALPKKPMQFFIGRFSLTEGRFRLDKYAEVTNYVLRPDVMDYEHLNVQDIKVQADSISFDDELVFQGILKNLSAKEKSGFLLSHVEAKKVVVCDTLVGLYGAKVQTAGTFLGDTIALHYGSYRDFNKFTDRVRMEVRLDKGSKLRVGDINYFSENVANNPFFEKNAGEVAEISGTISGKVNNLRGRDLDIKLDENTYMKGTFDGNNLTGTDVGPQTIGFKFETLRSDFTTITRIIPGFSAPEYFYRLGQIGFSGHYDNIFGYDHILEGKVTTDLGGGEVDLKLDLSDGRDNAIYSGHMDMSNFDLATWTGNPDFGPATFNVRIKEPSRGLTLKTLDASVEGRIDSFSYRNYNYQNISLNGNFKEYIFHGDLGVNDDNIKFELSGDINLKDTVPVFDFSAKLTRLDLGALNLMEEDWILSADIRHIRLKARRLEDLMGEIELNNFLVLQDHEQTHRMDGLSFASGYRADGTRFFKIRSDIIDGELTGAFDLTTVAKNLGQMFARQHPAFAARMGLPAPDSTVLTDDFTMWLQIKNTEGFTRLFATDLDTLRDIYANARVDTRRGYSQLLLIAPYVKYGGIEVQDVNLAWNGEPDTSFYKIRIPTATLSGKYALPPLRLDGYLTDEDLKFNLEAKDTASIVESINLDGVLSTVDSLWQIKFNASEIALFNTEWYMDEDNYIRFGKNIFEPRNFDLMSGNLRLNVDKHNEGRGLRLSMANFDLDFLNNFVGDTTLNINGRIASIDVTAEELYLLQGIEANIDVSEVFVKEKSYNSFYGYLKLAHLDAPLQWRFVAQKGIEQPTLRFTGAWLLSGDEPQQVAEFPNQNINPGEFRGRVVTDSFQLAVLETFVPGISKTAGKFNADASLSGTLNHIGVDGSVKILNGQFQMDYLKAMCHIRNQKITLSEYRIWADGDTIWDATERNAAVIRGGLKHNHFKDWALDCEIESLGNNFMMLNTLPEDNSMYYGQGIGKFKAVFSGTFTRTNIIVDATTGKETRLYIPVTSAIDAQAVNFITYKPKKQDTVALEDKTKSFVTGEITGLNLEMNLTVTEDAEVQLIFDEKAGDIIKGRGEGDITLVMTRTGEFKMYGSYQIRRGEYMFTLLNWVNKPFNVLSGGTINWYGDPYGAQINLDATYEENTSLYNLLRDELELIPSASNEAGKATKAVVTMHLKGDLMKPTISFDLDFPNISSQLKTLADNKLRLLRQDQNELNRQVFGLVVVGSFLPSNTGNFIQNSDYLASAFNTLTQVLSNQLSNYLSELAIEWFGGAVSSIDFDIAYNEYQNALTDPGQTTQIGRELEFRFTGGFANDRVTVQLGSQFGLGRPGTATTVQDGFLGEDVTVEIQLTENRQWRLKVYQRMEPDIAGGQRRMRYGFGISFRKDYDSFSDMMSGLTGWFRKKNG
ncbi:MAG: hypothetical protein DYG98_12950 [Haliscomenobacteraceae bacterium CHB4]|nr:hypothetical protein [Haliscomenobacteraceae bacterium CHB4]